MKYKYLNKVSYSALSSFSKKGINAFLPEKEDSYVPWFAVGNLVDVLLTGDKDKILENCTIIKEPLSTSLVKVCDYLINNNLDLTDENIVIACRAIPVFNNIKDEKKIISRFEDPFPLYYKCMKDSKKVIFKSDLILAKQVSGSILNNPHYQEILNNCKRAFQVRIDWKFEEQDMLSILDCLFLDDNNKEIHIIDIKSGSRKPEEFIQQFKVFEYDIQASFYYTSIEYLQEQGKLPKDYKVYFHFIYAPTIGDIKSVFVDVKENALKRCKDKWVSIFNEFIECREIVRRNGIQPIRLDECSYRISIE